DPADPVFFVDELVEGLDLGAFERRYDGMGEHAYPPRMLLKLWLFGAIAGVYSGREIARRLWWDLRFRYLAGELRADFRTINRFRERHREDFAGVLRQTLRIARASGLAQLEDEIAQILMQMDELNVREEEEHSDGDGGGGLPAELQRREQRREKIRAARQQLEREKGEKLEDRHQKSFADLEANMMKTGEGAMQYCYNAQAATSEDGIVVASAVSTSPSDAPQLVPMIDAVRENTGQRPELALADAGYRSEQNLSALRRRRQRCLVAIGRAGKSARWPTGRCTQRMHRLFRLPWARALYAHRKTQAERPFAEIKQRMRFRRFALRGQAKVRGEWDLVCAALNVVTIWRAQEA